MIRIIKVVRRKNKKAQEVIIEAGMIQLTFRLDKEEKIVEVERKRLEGVSDQENLWLPRVLYLQVWKRAWAILKKRSSK